MREGLRRIAHDRGEWAGLPMPLTGQPLVVEPRFPNAAGLMAIGTAPAAPSGLDAESDAPPMRARNRFWSVHKKSEIVVIEQENGRVTWGLVPGVQHFSMDLDTMGCVDAWGIEQETKAVELLAGMITPHALKCYVMTGMFLETSRRSGVIYAFRRLRPTVALGKGDGRGMRILACLCLHPIAYYCGTWAGAMCPTDDVIAHLSLMRGDEHLFWRRANQHPAWRPEACL